MKKITINYLSHDRPEYHELFFYFLSKIKSENKKLIKLSILSSGQKNWGDKCKKLNIDYEIVPFDGTNNYLAKIQHAVKSDTEYSMKLDEDCFFNNYIWDFFIENIKYLEDENILTLCPVMSNQIPSCDDFIDSYIQDIEFKNKIHNLFLQRKMPNGLWNNDYSCLNKFTVDSNKWDSKRFYEGVDSINTKLKGIHPLRISYESQIEINQYIIDNLNLFLTKNDYSFYEIKSPYFTNSCFFIKTKDWLEILDLSRIDAYDEVTLNLYKNQNNKKTVFVKNAYGIHLMFNTVYGNKNSWGIGGEDGLSYEKKFFEELKEKILK